MKHAVAALVTLFVAIVSACASSLPQGPIPGRYAVLIQRASNAPDDFAGEFEDSLMNALVGQMQSVERVYDMNAAEGYDSVILVSWAREYAAALDPGTVDASGQNISRAHIPKLRYEVLRNGTRVASGAVNNAGTEVAAANALAMDIARKLPR
jgi:hypothetical protein